MSKRWTYDDDVFLFAFHSVGANSIAAHDLGFKGKNAGENRVAKLKKMGVWDFLAAFHSAGEELSRAHTRAFGPEWAHQLLDDEASYSHLSAPSLPLPHLTNREKTQ